MLTALLSPDWLAAGCWRLDVSTGGIWRNSVDLCSFAVAKAFVGCFSIEVFLFASIEDIFMKHELFSEFRSFSQESNFVLAKIEVFANFSNWFHEILSTFSENGFQEKFSSFASVSNKLQHWRPRKQQHSLIKRTFRSNNYGRSEKLCKKRWEVKKRLIGEEFSREWGEQKACTQKLSRQQGSQPPNELWLISLVIQSGAADLMRTYRFFLDVRRASCSSLSPRRSWRGKGITQS